MKPNSNERPSSVPTLTVEVPRALRKPISIPLRSSAEDGELRFVIRQLPNGKRSVKAVADSGYGESGTETKIVPTAKHMRENILRILPVKQTLLKSGETLSREWVRTTDPYVYDRLGDKFLDDLVSDWSYRVTPKGKRKQPRGIVTELVADGLADALSDYKPDAIARLIRGLKRTRG